MSSTSVAKPWSNSGSLLVEALENLGVVVPAAVVDRHEAHAVLDQPPGQQAALAERVAAIALAQPALSCSMAKALRASGERIIVAARWWNSS